MGVERRQTDAMLRRVGSALRVQGYVGRYGPFGRIHLSSSNRQAAGPRSASRGSKDATDIRDITGRDNGAASPPTYPHVSVMLQEVLEAFKPVNMRVYLDCTLGAAGHAVEVVKAHPVG